MIAYLLKSATCLALLLAFYHLVLEREKMHNFNRYYLLGSVLFSFLVPLYTIYIEAVPAIVETINTPVVFYLTEDIVLEENTIEKSINYTFIFTGLYVLISLFFLIRFCRNLFTIINKTKKNKTITYQKAVLVLVDDKILPHTFWNYIFINKKDYKDNKIEQELFTHELTHVTQKHTIDVLILELIQSIFWINPFFVFLKKAIQLNHEFLADEKVITKHKNTSEYQYLLLNKAAWKNEYYLASNLNYSLTKKRLKMMTTQSSHTKILLKKLTVIPLLAGFVFLFAERVEAQEVQEIVENPIETIEEQLNSKEGYPIKTGFIEIKNNKYFYVDVNKTIKYYNKNGILSDKNGRTLSNKKANASEVLPDNYITKTYFNNKVFCEFQDDKPSKKAKWQKLPNGDKIKIIEVNESQKKASKEELQEYNSLILETEKNKIIKVKDVAKLKTIYKSMSKDQKDSVKSIDKVLAKLPPPPKTDWVFTYQRLAHRIKTTSKNRKANLIYLEKIYKEKLSETEKAKVDAPQLLIPPPPPKPNAKKKKF